MPEGGNGSMVMILLIGGVGCCCLVSIVVPVILYLTNQQFKDWVNGLFGKKDDGGGGEDNNSGDDPAGGGAAGNCKFDPATKKGTAGDLPGYDPTACAGKCLYTGNNSARIAKDGAWVKPSTNECTDWLKSPRAGKYVCPFGYTHKDPKLGYWCKGKDSKGKGKVNMPAFTLPADARVGQMYKVVVGDKSVKGVYSTSLYEQYKSKNIELGKNFTDAHWPKVLQYRATEDDKPYPTIQDGAWPS